MSDLVERLAVKRELFSASKKGDGYTWSYAHEAEWWLNAIAEELDRFDREANEKHGHESAKWPHPAAEWLRSEVRAPWASRSVLP